LFIAEGAPGQPGATQGKPFGTRGVLGYESGGMPFFKDLLTPEQIAAVVAYERSL
jgi:mono/diheme cytochrome c family protein